MTMIKYPRKTVRNHGGIIKTIIILKIKVRYYKSNKATNNFSGFSLLIVTYRTDDKRLKKI